MGERVSMGDEAGTADRVLILRGIEGTTAFGVSCGLCVCVREVGRGGWGTGLLLRDGAGLRTPFLEGARLGTPLDGDGAGLTSRGFAAADGRLRGKNTDIGLREDAFEEGRRTACTLSGGGTGLVSLARFGAGGQTWSLS